MSLRVLADPVTQTLGLRESADIPEPDDESLQLVLDSFWLLGDVDQLAQRFDARLLLMVPAAANTLTYLYPRGGERFISALLRPVDALAAGSEAPDEAMASAQLRELGEQLALVRAVRDSYTSNWTTTLGSAWAAVQSWLVSLLQLGVRTARLTEAEDTLGLTVVRIHSANDWQS
jgi:hypothetical protein